MIAFVLSGGGSRGALQAGALKALIEAGIQPDLVVGSSAGAVNATALAIAPCQSGIQRLLEFWRNVDRTRIYNPNLMTIAVRMLLGRDSLASSKQFHRFIRRHVLPQAHTFGDIQDLRLYITAVDLQTGCLTVFGDDPEMNLVDAIMASTSIQPFFPPWTIEGRRYIDGGYLSNLPVQAAIERGADEIYALDLTTLELKSEWSGVISILLHEADIVLQHLAQTELSQARMVLGERLHHIALSDYDSLGLFDFSLTEAMIERGEIVTKKYLMENSTYQIDMFEDAPPMLEDLRRNGKNLSKAAAL